MSQIVMRKWMIASNKYETIKHVLIQSDANQCMLIPQQYPPSFAIRLTMQYLEKKNFITSNLSASERRL